MIKMMNRISSTAMLAVAFMLCATSAWAATPVAVWDGDFTASQTGFNLNRNGNAISQDNSTITIDKNVGVKVDFTTGVDAITVMFKYSELALNAQKTIATSFCSGYDENRTGVYLVSGGTVKGIWNTSDWANPSETPLSQSSGILAFCYSKSSGTALYYVTSSASTQLYNRSDLKAGNDTAINGCTIGGERAKTGATLLSAATGMKITGLAIFNGTLSGSDMTGYVWPSDKYVIEISESKSWSQLTVPEGVKNIVLNITGDATLTIDENISLDELGITSTDSELTLNVAQGVTAAVGAYDCSQAQGSVTLNISQGTASVRAGSDTVLNGLGTGSILIPAGKRLTISESGMKKSQLTNNGTLHIVGGTESTPIEIYDNGGANTGMGVITLAANAYVRNNATSGNKLYTITGAADGSSTLVLSSGQNWGMTNGTQIRNCKVLIRDRNFWWERASAFDKTVDLDYGTITLHLGNPDSTFEIGSFTGSGSISRDNASDTLTIYADRIDGAFSCALSNIPLTVKGTHVQSITAATGSITVDGGIVQLGSQTVSSLQNGGTVKYAYSAKPTLQTYTGSGVFVVDMTGTTLVAGTQYHVVDAAGVTEDKVSVTGVTDDSFQLYTVADGVVLADESPSAAIWTGNSGTWSDSTFDGKAIETAGAPVAFADAKSGAESVTVTLDGPKTVEAANFTANTTAYELTGNALTGPISLAGTAPVTLKVAPVIGNGGLSGTGPIVLDFGENSTFTMSANNTAYDGEATIASGTVKMGDAKSFGNFGRTGSIRVKSGATLDANGASNNANTGVNNKLILESGASFSNSVSLSDTKFFAFYDLTLEGDATIVADTANNGLTRHYNSETYVHLGTNTLTKTGSNTFYMAAPTIDGTGTIDITEGVLSLSRAYTTSTQPTFSSGTFRVRSGATLTLQNYNGGANLTTKKIVLEGTGCISGTGSASATDGVELRTVNGVDTAYPTIVTAATAVSATGNGTLAFGEARPSNTVSLGENVGISVKMQNSADSVIELKLDRTPASVTVYDESGSVCENSDSSYDADSGVLTVFTTFTIEASSGTVDFDSNSSWTGGTTPSTDDRIIIIATGDVTLSVEGTYSLDVVTVKGGGSVSFSGSGSISADTVAVKDGTTLAYNDNISATTSISLDSGTVLKLNGVTENAAISGAGAVETYGAVTFNANNTFTGGLTVKSGSTARTIKTGIGGQGYGKNNYGQAIANLSRIVVEDGGSLDLANSGDACYAITIAGKGVKENGVYKGALYNSGNEIGDGSRQTASLTLSADAMVRAEGTVNGWGLVNSGHAATVLALNGHTLTVSGLGYFPIVNANTASGTTTTGTLVLDGVKLGLVSTSSNFTGVNIVAKGCATLNMSIAPTAIGSLTLKPTASGTTASAWNLPAGLVPVIDASNIDPSGLSYGANLTLFTAPNETNLTDSNISAKVGSRYTTTISGNTVTATVKAGVPTNFMHYDFNAANSIASDSTYNIGNLNPVFVETRNGKAGTFDSSTKPYYDSNTSTKSPFYAGEMTITTLLKPMEASNTILWNFGSAFGPGIALIAKDSSTLALVSWTGDTDGTDVVSVSEVAGLLNNWHLVTIVANSRGTTLYVDNKSASVSTVLPTGIGAQGQFGSIHGKVKNYAAVSDSGFLLDDWRVYDAALTAAELESIKTELVYVDVTVPTVANTTVTVTANGTPVEGDNGVYTVPYGSAVVVTYAAVSGYKISGTDTYQIASATTDATISVDQDLSSDLIVATFNGTSYTTLQAAVDAWAAAGMEQALNPVTLIGNTTVAGLTISAQNTGMPIPMQLMGGGYTLTGPVTIAADATLQPSNITLAGNLTVNGTLVVPTTLSVGGTVTFADESCITVTTLSDSVAKVTATGAVTIQGDLLVYLQSASLEAGTYLLATGSSVDADDAVATVQLNGTEDPAWTFSATETSLVLKAVAAEVEGVKYETFAEAVDAADGVKTITLLANASYTLTVGEVLIVDAESFTMTVTAPDGYAVAQSGSGVVTYTTQKYVARLQNPEDGTLAYQPAVDYTSLAAAVAAVTERSAGYYGGGDAIVTLLDDVTLDVTVTVSKKMNLNLNGKTLTASGINAINNSTKLAVQGSSGSIAVTSGNSVVLTDAAATLTVSGGVTILPAPATNVSRSRVVSSTSAGTTTYRVEVIPGTIFSVY